MKSRLIWTPLPDRSPSGGKHGALANMREQLSGREDGLNARMDLPEDRSRVQADLSGSFRFRHRLRFRLGSLSRLLFRDELLLNLEGYGVGIDPYTCAAVRRVFPLSAWFLADSKITVSITSFPIVLSSALRTNAVSHPCLLPQFVPLESPHQNAALRTEPQTVRDGERLLESGLCFDGIVSPHNLGPSKRGIYALCLVHPGTILSRASAV